MQVINVTDKVMKYHTKGTTIVLNPGVITQVSEDLTTAKKLKDCYGSRIKIVDGRALERQYAAFSGNAKPVEPSTDIEKKLENQYNAFSNNAKPVEPPVEEDAATEPTEEPKVTPEPTEELIVEPELEEGTNVEVPEVKEEVKEPKVAKKPSKSKGRGSKKNK